MYYLHSSGYEIKEFPRILARPPVDPYDFTYKEIKNRIITLGQDDNGIVRYITRTRLVAHLTFEQKKCNIEVTDSLDQKFIEISTRQASFNNMYMDEKLAEIANLIENLLKQNGKFIELEYEKVCCGFVNDSDVEEYRKKMQCFRHGTDEAIAERMTYSKEQKNFLVDYGLTIVKAIHELVKKWSSSIGMKLVIESTKTAAGKRVLPMIEDVEKMFRSIIEHRQKPVKKRAIDAYKKPLVVKSAGGFLLSVYGIIVLYIKA